MSRAPGFPRLSRIAVVVSFGSFLVFGAEGRAADALSYFKNYFVTGDVVIGGVGGLRGTGVNGFTTGTININGVPAGADIVAAFLYWETVETSLTPSGDHGFFDGKAIVGDVRGNPNNTPCWSSGGTGGSNTGAGRVYSADVLRYLPHDPVTDSFRVANGPHTVKLRDSGGSGNGNIVYVDGASLVVVYRTLQTPGTLGAPPLRSVVIYDGAFTMTKLSASMTQAIGGFYDAVGGAGAAKMTHIVANGQSGNSENLTINNNPIPGNPFTGTAGPRWDNPTFNFSPSAHQASVATQVTSSDKQICLTWAAIVTTTPVWDSDNDGLVDIWETNGLHFNPGVPADSTHALTPATFRDCAYAKNVLIPAENCEDLPAMGANPNVKDIFLEFDWLHGNAWSSPTENGSDHTHTPKFGALKMVADAFHAQGINLHFDVGNNYQGSLCGNPGATFNCIIPFGAGAQGGEVIEESTLLCPRPGVSVCAYADEQYYSVLSWKVGFHEVKDGSPALGMPSHFSRDRKDIFHYVLLAHAIAIPELSLTPPYSPTGHPKSVSGVADWPGGDLMVTLGRWRSDLPENDQVGSVLVQAGTLMHEIGHNLNLSHAGLVRTPNCIPNYPSIMNYLYQSRGLTAADGSAHVDYSYGTLTAALNEGLLSETASLGAPVTYRIRYFGPVTASDPPDSAAKLHCDGTPLGPADLPMLRLENTFPLFIDWDHNAVSTPGTLSLDVNYDGQTATLRSDFNDWSNLNLQQVSTRVSVGELSLDDQITDLAASDPGAPDYGAPDYGAPDYGAPDYGAPDYGAPDYGAPDYGDDVDYRTQILSTVDPPPPPSPDCPTCGLKATNKIDRITLSLTAPGTGHIDTYNFYRKNADVPGSTFTFLKGVPGGAATITTDDTTAQHNVNYTYYATSVASSGTSTIESGASNTASGIVKHLSVTANASRQYGQPIPPLVSTITGLDIAALNPALVTCTTTATSSSPLGSYPTHCTGPAAVTPIGGTTAIDGITYTDGILTIRKADQTITFLPLPDKTFADADFTVSATASSGLTVTFTASGNCSVTGTTVHLTGVGSCTITAHQAGDNNYNAAPDVSRTFAITKAIYSVTMSALKTPVKIGSAIPVNFRVTNASGGVLSDTSIVSKIETSFNGAVPVGGCVVSSNGLRQLAYRANPSFYTGNSNLRFVSSQQGYQFNLDSTFWQISRGGNGSGCYTILIYLNDGVIPATTNGRVSSAVEVRD